MKRRGLFLVALLAALSLLVAACGSDSDDDTSASEGDDAQTDVASDDTEETEADDTEETEAEDTEETEAEETSGEEEEGEGATYVGTEFAFEGSDTLPAGPTTLELDNQGEQVHELAVFKLLEGKTIDDVNALLKKGVPGKPPTWVRTIEGVGAKPGETGSVDVDLEAGDYVFLCLVPDKESKMPHVALGMIKGITVE